MRRPNRSSDAGALPEKPLQESLPSGADYLLHLSAPDRRGGRRPESAQEAFRLKALELSARNEELQHFAYIVSHELRSPLVILSQYLRIMEKQGMICSNGTFYLDRMKSQIEAMEDFIDRTLALSKAGQRIGSREPVDMDSLVRALFNECAPEGVRADLVIADALPEIQADRMKIVQVVRNLLCNAFKCRDEGKDGIVITAGYSRTPQDHVFMITDNGIGMSASTLKKIFLLGYSERRSGSEIGGFGLSICAKIVEAHGGQLRATSPGVGKGSTFTFTIPLKDHSA